MEQEKILALFEAVGKNNFKVRNRFLRSATWLGGADDNSGELLPAEIERITETAAGGAGVIIPGFAYISEEGKALPRQWGLHCDKRTADAAKLAKAVHEAKSKLFIQLAHAGSQRSPNLAAKSRTLSPSGKNHPGKDFASEAMTEEDIAAVCENFARAALRAKCSGADGIEIHGGHGFLLTQFLSPVINERTDRYGGNFENRSRIFFEIYEVVRDAVGTDFPIWYKISISEGTERGYGSDEGLYAAKLLLDAGVDGIEVSNGTSYAGGQNIPSVIGISAGESEAPSAKYAAELRKYASPDKVIILTGGVRSLKAMSEMAENNVCDLFGFSRPFIAEPDLINRWYYEDDRPSACLSCNACFNTADRGMIDCPVIRERNEGLWDPLPEC